MSKSQITFNLDADVAISDSRLASDIGEAAIDYFDGRGPASTRVLSAAPRNILDLGWVIDFQVEHSSAEIATTEIESFCAGCVVGARRAMISR